MLLRPLRVSFALRNLAKNPIHYVNKKGLMFLSMEWGVKTHFTCSPNAVSFAPGVRRIESR
jgi:hypothetical protein